MKKFIAITGLVCMLIIITGCGKKYACDEGTLDGDKCKVIEKVAANKNCNEGFKLNNENCEKADVIASKEEKTCPKGYTLSGSTCYSDETVNMTTTTGCNDVAYAKKYIKNKGWTTKEGEPITRVWVEKKDNKCIYWYDFGTADLNWEESLVSIKACPSGYTKVNNTCKKSSKLVTSYKCDEGYTLNSDNKCEKTITETPTFSCEDGYTVNGNMCEKTVTKDAVKK